MFRAFFIEANWVTRMYSALFIIGVSFIVAIGVAAMLSNANAHANSGATIPPPIPASSSTSIVACPEDAIAIGGVCIPADNFGACRVAQTFAQRVYRVDDMRNTPRVRVAFNMRDRVCNWQHAFFGGIR